jgi:integrase
VGLAGKKTKKWIGKWHPYRADGVRTTERIVLGEKAKMTKWQAEDALRDHIAKKTEQQIRCPEGDPTLQQFWERSYLPSRTWGVAMKAAVSNVIAHHLLPQFGATRIADLDKLTLQRHLNALAESYSRSLVQKVLRQLRAMLEEAVEQDLIAKNPARRVKMPNTRRPCGRFLSEEELSAMMAQLDFRDRLIFWMFVNLGFRPAELFALRWNDIKASEIRIDEAATQRGMMEPKTHGSNANVAVPPEIEEGIHRWRAMQKEIIPAAFMFPTATGLPIASHNYERDVIVPAAIRAGIMSEPPKDRKKGDPIRDKTATVNFQALRRTYATWGQYHGSIKDVQGGMRHSSPDQTLKVYMGQVPDGVRKLNASLAGFYRDQCGFSLLDDAPGSGAVN